MHTPNTTKSCAWTGDDPLMIKYHDEVWGVPEHDSKKLFAKLILDGFQAGLSWRTILHKQENFMKAFDGFDPDIVAKYDDAKIQELLQDAGIIRNRAKVRAAVHNAQKFIELRDQGIDFSTLLWSFVDGKSIVNSWTSDSQIPASSPESDAMSKELTKLGFKFVGTTIVYAFMQAVGMVNDHLVDCYRYSSLTLS